MAIRPSAQLGVKLQILAAVVVPIALLLGWLGSHGFFNGPA